MTRFVTVVVATAAMASSAVHAQTPPGRFDAGIHASVAASTQFDSTDAGVGGRVAWRPLEGFGVESEVTFYPREFPDARPFSRNRLEGLFGVTLGTTVGGVMPFVKLRSGFLRMGDAPKPLACILIFPPPLACELASGRTLPAFDIGGGIDLLAARPVYLRIDAGDRLLRYPGPVIDGENVRREGSFMDHDFRFAVGAGWRF